MEFIFSLPGVYLDWWSPGGLYRTRPPPACSWPGSAPQGPSWHWEESSGACHRECRAPSTPGMSPGQCSPLRTGRRSSQTGCLWNNGMYFGQLCKCSFLLFIPFREYSLKDIVSAHVFSSFWVQFTQDLPYTCNQLDLYETLTFYSDVDSSRHILEQCSVKQYK